jgi:AcrR family transcriptional regulator
MSAATRPYRQVARAAAAEQTRARILDALAEAIERTWIDEVTLDEIAAKAGTTRQTVIRLYGGKEGLLAAVAERIGQQVVLRRALPPGPLARAVAHAVARDYEVSGDMVLRLLAQEGRYPIMTTLLDIGRRWHREWVETTCAAALAARLPAARRRLLDQLVVVTDVYTWKLLRRDMRHPAAEAEAIVADMLGKLLEEESPDA